MKANEKTTLRLDRLSGPDGLLTAVVATAWEDATAPGPYTAEARAYLAGGLFSHHCDLLGVGPGPAAIPQLVRVLGDPGGDNGRHNEP